MPIPVLRHFLSPLGLRFTKLALGAIAALLILVSIYSATLILRQQKVMRDISRYNVTWQTSQAAYELSRLEIAVGAYAAGISDIDADELQLRLDIVLNRVQLFESGELAAFVGISPDLSGVVHRFRRATQDVQSLLDHLPDADAPRKLLQLLTPINPMLTQLSAAAHDHSERLFARDLDKLDRLYEVITVVLVLLIGSSLGLIVILANHNRMLVFARDDIQKMANDLQRSGEVLRTTMQELEARNAVLLLRDLTLLEQNGRFTAALNNMSQALIMVDAGGCLIVANTRFATLFGLDFASLKPGTSLMQLFAAVRMGQRYGKALIKAVVMKQSSVLASRQSCLFVHEDSDGHALSISHQPMADGGWVATYEDISERRQAEAQVRYIAYHDALTNLPNRRAFQERLEEMLGKQRRSLDGVAVHCIDLDFFKHVNDTLGHPAGDALLMTASDRLRACLRKGDMVARLGGDEFAILQGVCTEAEAEELARRVLHALRLPYEVAGRQVVVGASIGIAFDGNGASGAQQLFTNADLALYRAKARGRNACCLFEPSMEADQKTRFLMGLELREGLERNELELHYQPIFNLQQGKLSGYEALVRWRSPTRGLVMPGEFIPIAEECHLISEIGEWVLRRACHDAARWRAQVKVAVNLSPMQFRNNNDFVQTVCDVLAEARLAPERLELEITESVLLQNEQSVLEMLHDLRAIGVHMVLDDFGTGYSSLSYLCSFPFDKIKVDQSFVRDLGIRSDCKAIIDSISGLAQKLGMLTIAEGVETEEQLRQLREYGLDEVQGYLLGRPAPNHTIEMLEQVPVSEQYGVLS